jgi:large subunit ribosomal protein L2
MCGCIQYLPATTRSTLFSFSYVDTQQSLYSVFSTSSSINSRYIILLNTAQVGLSVCYVSTDKNKKPTIALACGTSCKVATNSSFLKYNLCQVMLPSGKLKLIKSDIAVLVGAILPVTTYKYINTHAGYWRNLGKKPRVRGVVKNPVDHPHGGRCRTVMKPRSP